MRAVGAIRIVVFGAALLCFLSDLAAQSYQRINLPKRPAPVKITNQGKGHALRTAPPLRPFTYLVTPNPTNNQERAFSATTPNPNSWVRAGTDVNRKFGDYYVDPAGWTNNFGLSPTNALWRNPNNPTNWISTRAIRRFLRRPFTLRFPYSQVPPR